MVEIKTWDRGETVTINNSYTDSDDAAYDPSTVELKIYDPSGTLIDTLTYAAAEIIKVSTGVYYYDYDIPDDATIGWWITKWTGATGSFLDVSRDQFKVADPEEKLYCTPEEVWVRAGQDETFVSRLNVTDYIRQSMAEIDEIYQKSFNYSNDVTEWFDTSQPDTNTKLRSVFLTYTPVRSITSVKEYDTSDTEVQSYDSDDYWIDLGTGKIQMKTKEFEHQKHRVEVVYKYGYDTIPQKITNLCIILSAMKVLLNFIGESVDQVTSYNACGICMVGDVELLTVDGYQTFESLSGKDVQLINKDGDISDGKVWYTGEREVIELILNNSATIKCTPEHLFMVEEGYGVQAKGLMDKKLMLYSSDEDIRVVEINHIGIEKVYDFNEPLVNWGVIDGGINEGVNGGIIVKNSVSVGEPYTASARATEFLVKERDKLLSEIGRLRPSIFIV